jgi:DNA-directed RNA polymerase subunit N (RpoN/RPB10)
MIVPIRCFTCGKVIADKYEYYISEVAKLQNSLNQENKPNSGPNKLRETQTGPSKKDEGGPSKKDGGGPSKKDEGGPSRIKEPDIQSTKKETFKHFDKIMTGEILDKLQLNRYCCRRMLLGTVDMMDFI